MIKRTRQKRAGAMREWTVRDRQAFVLVAACAYLASLFLAWWEVGIGDSENPDRTMRMDGLGGGTIGTNRLSEFCVVIAVAILVFALAALRSHDHRLPLVLRELAIALVIFNALSVLELWRSMTNSFPSFFQGGHLAAGAYVAIATSLLVLFSVLVLDAGGVRRLFTRDRTRDARSATTSEADH